MTTTNPFSIPGESNPTDTPQVANTNIESSILNEIITAFETSGDFEKEEYAIVLTRVKSTLNSNNIASMNEVLVKLQTSRDPNEIQRYVLELQSISQRHLSDSADVSGSAHRQEQAEAESRFEGIFGTERWAGLKETWNIERSDYGTLERLIDLLGDALIGILDVGVDLAGIVLIEGGSLSLGALWDVLSYLIENDIAFFNYLAEKDNSILWYLWAYAHVNGGLIAGRYARDYITSNYGDQINKRFPPATTTQTGEDGSTRNVNSQRLIGRIFGRGYLDAVDSSSNIFSISDEVGDGVSEKQNEYLKRRKTMDILKKYYFDDPQTYSRLQKIETRYLQSNTRTYWRELHGILTEKGLFKRVLGGILTPDFLKQELEQKVITLRQELQKNHYKAISLLYRTSDGPNGVEIHKDQKTDFLKGLEYEINSNPNLTPTERARRITDLDNFLNRITGDTLLDEKKILEELFRIKEGNATKISMLEKIQSELDAVRKGGLITRTRGALTDLLKWRRGSLIRFRNQIAAGSWNGSYKDFENHLSTIKASNTIHRIPNQTIDFGDQDRFVRNTEARVSEMAENEKMYNSSAATHLENGIRYIVPDNAIETEMRKVYDQFMEMKTPYTEIEFFRELERIGNGYLPSNILLLRLEKAKAELERERTKPNIENKNRLRRLVERIRIDTADIPGITPAERISASRHIMFAAGEIQNGNYRIAMNALQEIPNSIKTGLGNQFAELQRLGQIAISTRPRLADGTTPINTNAELDTKIANVENFMNAARNGNVDLHGNSISEIKDGTLTFESGGEYITSDFTEADKTRYEESLKEYRGIEEFDFKTRVLSGDTSNLSGIEDALRAKFENEIHYLKLISEIDGTINNFGTSLEALAGSIHENDYTRGQVSAIMERLITGENFNDIDINNIITSTADHSQQFSGGQALKDQLSLKYGSLSSEEKGRILEIIKNNEIDSEHLPENIKRGLDRLDISPELAGHAATLRRIMGNIDGVDNMEDLRQIKSRFDGYIESNTSISPDDEEFKSIIEEFETKYNETRSVIAGAEVPNNEFDSRAEFKRVGDYTKAARIEIILQYGAGVETQEKLAQLHSMRDALNSASALQDIVDIKAHYMEQLGLEQLRTVSTLRSRINAIGYDRIGDGYASFSALDEAIRTTTDTSILNNISRSLQSLRIIR